MNLDPKLLQQLITTFASELEEHTEIITQGLLALEKNPKNDLEKNNIIGAIFRSAHNIKGAARGIGINDVGDIAHHIESLFSALQNNQTAILPKTINLSLEAIDKMKLAMQAFQEHKSISFDLNDLLSRLDNSSTPNLQSSIAPIAQPKSLSIETPSEMNQPIMEKSQESIRIPLDKINMVSELMEDLQVNKIGLEDHYTEVNSLLTTTKQFADVWHALANKIKTHLGNELGENFQRLIHQGNDSFSEMRAATDRLYKNIREHKNDFSLVINMLQDEIRLLRLIPATQLLNTLTRYSRDLAQQLNKEINLEISGDDVRLDKLILEGLKDPLIHLLRNAIDHGIETPTLRTKLGKPSTGTIKINIKDEGNQILISIADDGAGIDSKKIATTVQRKNLMSAANLSQMTEDEVIEFIFQPGFSTQEIITDVSGRGVGLDIVKSALNNLKGSVQVKTLLGQGTTFYLRLPLTLSSEHGLLVKANDDLFVIPTHAIDRILSIPFEQIFEVEGTQAIRFDNHTVPLRVLTQVLGMKNNAEKNTEQLSIVILKNQSQLLALSVDEVIGEREIVIKPLTKPLQAVPGISGGTLLDRNQVVLVLNPNELFAHALERKENYITLNKKSQKTTESPHILVVDDSITTRTLEKNILEAKNYQVTVAVNGKEAWDLIQKKKFSMVITDVSMPIMDGFTLTEQVKKSEKFRDLPVIIVTSLGSDQEKARGVAVGADAYIIKNQFESSALLEIVAQLV